VCVCAAYCYICSLSVCLLVTTIGCAKMAELIEMTLGMYTQVVSR